jgi:hypothetical protein
MNPANAGILTSVVVKTASIQLPWGNQTGCSTIPHLKCGLTPVSSQSSLMCHFIFQRRNITMARIREIVTKATKDEAFRKRLLSDAKATIEKEFKLEFPKDVVIKVHQDSPTVINIVLPAPLEVSSDRPLSTKELENVAGGRMSNFVTLTNCKCT